MVETFTLYNLVAGSLAGAGLLYLLYVEQFVGGYKRFLMVTTLGLLLFAVGGPIVDVLLPEYVHFVHGFAALLVIFGLYDPVKNDVRTNEWASILLKDPASMRHPAEWMVPMDERILELFHDVDLVLTPSIIAYNIDFSREEVNRRLTELETAGLVERVERGKYHITDTGVEYLTGELYASLLEQN